MKTPQPNIIECRDLFTFSFNCFNSQAIEFIEATKRYHSANSSMSSSAFDINSFDILGFHLSFSIFHFEWLIGQGLFVEEIHYICEPGKIISRSSTPIALFAFFDTDLDIFIKSISDVFSDSMSKTDIKRWLDKHFFLVLECNKNKDKINDICNITRDFDSNLSSALARNYNDIVLAFNDVMNSRSYKKALKTLERFRKNPDSLI